MIQNKWKNNINQFLLFVFVQLLFVTQISIAQKVSWYSKDKGITSPEHKKYVKQVIWSKSVIVWDNVANSVLETRFKLTDPIYGRIFLDRSIHNTPVYSSVSNEPEENTRNSIEWKLYIDGKDTGGRFGVFHQGQYDDDHGKNWTTWQFSPHVLNPDWEEDKIIGTAWEKAVRGLSPGEHSVRFEMWGVSGQFRSSEPMTVGTFTLVVSKGEKVATLAKFPKETYSGNDASQLREQLKKALATGKISYSDIVKLAITSNWAYKRYKDSKKEYRMISAAVLFSDKDNDGVCRFVTYNLISDKTGNGWTAPRFHSFCMGCPEGDVNCSE